MYNELLAVGAIAACFLGIGIAVESAAHEGHTVDWSAPSGWLVHGWAVLCSIGVIAAFGGAKLRDILAAAALFGVSGLLALGVPNRSRRNVLLVLLLATSLVGPLLWIASRTPATIFDEFGQWLPNARFLYENDSFPTASNPNVWSGKPGYPPGIPLAIFAGSELSGEFTDGIAKILVIVIAVGFGLALADLLFPRIGRRLALVVGVAIATVLNPFFDPRIALTAYADTPSAFILGLIVLAAWTYLKQPNIISGCRVATSAVVLVLLRDTNLAMLAGVVVGLLVCAWVQSTMRPVRLAALIVAAGGVPFVGWRIYLDIANIPPAMMVRPVGAWDWLAPITVLRALALDRLAGNPILGGGAVLLVISMVVLARRLIRHANRGLVPLFVIINCVIVVWLIFLAFAYSAVFAPEEVARAASAWRYLSQLGPIVLLALTAAFAGASAAQPQTPFSHFPAAIVGALLLVAGEFVTWRYWHIDCRYADVAALHQIASSLAVLGAVGDAPLTIVNPFEAAAYAIQLDYDLHRPSGRSRGVNDLSQSATDGLILDLTSLARATAFMDTSSAQLLRRTRGELFPVVVTQSQPIGPSCQAFWHL